jgi:hypothetical protein
MRHPIPTNMQMQSHQSSTESTLQQIATLSLFLRKIHHPVSAGALPVHTATSMMM